MRYLHIAAICLLASAMASAGPLQLQPSPHAVPETMARLTQTVEAKGFRVFVEVDHAAGAASVGMDLRPTRLLIFGNPKGGTALMQQAQTAGVDLPLKYLVWKDEAGRVWVGWNDPQELVTRHGLRPDTPVIAKMRQGLAGMAKQAVMP